MFTSTFKSVSEINRDSLKRERETENKRGKEVKIEREGKIEKINKEESERK